MGHLKASQYFGSLCKVCFSKALSEQNVLHTGSLTRDNWAKPSNNCRVFLPRIRCTLGNRFVNLSRSPYMFHKLPIHPWSKGSNKSFQNDPSERFQLSPNRTLTSHIITCHCEKLWRPAGHYDTRLIFSLYLTIAVFCGVRTAPPVRSLISWDNID